MEAKGHQWGGSLGKLMQLVWVMLTLKMLEGDLHEAVSKQLEKNGSRNEKMRLSLRTQI